MGLRDGALLAAKRLGRSWSCREEYLDFLGRSEAIDAPADLADQPFGVRGGFEGFTTYAFAWRVGDAIQIATVAPSGQAPGPESTIELAEELARAETG